MLLCIDHQQANNLRDNQGNGERLFMQRQVYVIVYLVLPLLRHPLLHLFLHPIVRIHQCLLVEYNLCRISFRTTDSRGNGR
jgi:hypothetical protein